MSSIAFVGGIGPLEIGIVLLIVLIIFGPKRIPELGRSLGAGMRGFKETVTGKDRDDEDQDQDQLGRPAKVDATADDGERASERTPAGPAADSRP